MSVRLLESVELIDAMGDLGAGAHGVVVELYDDGLVAEVEFLDDTGETIAVEPVPAIRLRATADANGRPLART